MINMQQMLGNIMGNSQVMQNPIVKNAYDMMQKGNSKGLEQMARNIAKEKGLDVEQIRKQLGM